MTLQEAKAHDTSSATNASEHHKEAAEHLEMAAKSHKEVVKLLSTNDHKGAAIHAEIAHDHTNKAKDHVVAANKKITASVK